MNLKINEIDSTGVYEGILMVKNVTNGVTAGKQKYLNFVLQDNSGTIEGKKWSVTDEEIESFKLKDFVLVKGEVILYRDKYQIKILEMTKLDNKDVSPRNFALECPADYEALVRKLKKYTESITNADARLIVERLINKYYDNYITFPAASVVHHAHLGGILFHSITMCDLAYLICNVYSDIDKDILIAGAILHDIGKTIELSGLLATEYTVEGKLYGHISIVYHEILKTAEELNITSETVMLLAHMVLSHHGELQFGSPVLPQTLEAYVLHQIDNIDSRINIILSATKNLPEGKFSERMVFLDGQNLYKPKGIK